MTQKAARLQHYVPQFLLRRFAGADGKLWAYDAEKRKMFPGTPKSLAAEGYFYGDTTKHATEKSSAIERWFADKVESPGAEAIELLLAKRTLSTKQVGAFCTFVAAQMQRTPASLQQQTDFLTPAFQETAERMVKYDSRFKKNVIARMKTGGATDAKISKLVQILDDGKFTITPTRGYAFSIGLRMLKTLVPELAKMRWKFLDIHPIDPNLIIGDHPVTLTNIVPEGTPTGPLGVKNPNVEIAVPLSSRMVALGHWDGPISYGELAPGMADMLNERTLRYAHRFVYASFKSEELLARAVSLHATGPKIRTRRIQLGKELFIISEFR